MFICIQTNYLKNTCLFAEKYQKSNGMLPPTPNIQPNHQSRWIWPSQHTTTQLQYALSWFASCYLSPMSALETLTIKTPKKKKTSQKTIRSLATWTLPPSPSFWKRSALQAIGASPGNGPTSDVVSVGWNCRHRNCLSGARWCPFFFSKSPYIYIYHIIYRDLHSGGGGLQQKIGAAS